MSKCTVDYVYKLQTKAIGVLHVGMDTWWHDFDEYDCPTLDLMNKVVRTIDEYRFKDDFFIHGVNYTGGKSIK